jgi:hypothetical protein
VGLFFRWLFRAFARMHEWRVFGVWGGALLWRVRLVYATILCMLIFIYGGSSFRYLIRGSEERAVSDSRGDDAGQDFETKMAFSC